MHLVEKSINGSQYYYLVRKQRRGRRVVTSQTIYIGNRQKLAELLQDRIEGCLPESFAAQEVGGSLALTSVARDLGIEEIIDDICPVRAGATPLGRQLLLVAIHRALTPRWSNSKASLQASYTSSALAELLPLPENAVDRRRLCETLASLSSKTVEKIESAIVERIIEREGVGLDGLAFDTTNFDSYAAASTRSQLLQRGHGKSGRPLRVLGLGLLVAEEDGLPLLTFSYPGNENDVTAFGRFLRALDRRSSSLKLPVSATIAADGGNISREMLARLERVPRYYVLRLPRKHAAALGRKKSKDLPPLSGKFKDMVWAEKQQCPVYGEERCVVDVYSRRMHQRQTPGLLRDRKKARADLQHLQRLLQNQREGRRRAKHLTMATVRRRAKIALAREHMADLFQVTVGKDDKAPTLTFEESPTAWQHLQDYVLGRTLLVTNRTDWTPERIVGASRLQSNNESFFKDLKNPCGTSMLPLRHRRDAALRTGALTVVLGLALAKVVHRRVRKAGVKIATTSGLLRILKQVKRARLHLSNTAPPALRAYAKNIWIPSTRAPRQAAVLAALHIEGCRELGTTLFSPRSRSPHAKPRP